jgi:flagellar basal body-associated protein FliL
VKTRRPTNRAGFSLVTALVVAAVIVAAAASGLLVAFGLSKQAGTTADASSDATDQAESVAATEFLEFGPVVANLAEGKLTRYLKVDVTLQVKAADAVGVTSLFEDGQKAVFKNWLIGYLSDKTREEVKGTANMNKLRREIQDGFNAILTDCSEYRIESVLFTEFNVQ